MARESLRRETIRQLVLDRRPETPVVVGSDVLWHLVPRKPNQSDARMRWLLVRRGWGVYRPLTKLEQDWEAL